MNWDVVAGNWKHFKEQVKAEWSNLTDDELEAIAGKRVARQYTANRLRGGAIEALLKGSSP
jgi:uncharacterized protein YjbJ (UPF0337 family)